MNTKKTRTKRTNETRLPTQIIGNIGLFHVCYELSRRGLNAVPTSRNTKSVDVIVGTEDFSRHVTVQVKTSSTQLGTRVAPSKKSKATKGEAVQKAKLADFWVFVLLNKTRGYEVQEIAVCESGDETLLTFGNTDWWYEPWYPTKDDEVTAKWSRQKGEGGWNVIEKFLHRKR